MIPPAASKALLAHLRDRWPCHQSVAGRHTNGHILALRGWWGFSCLYAFWSLTKFTCSSAFDMAKDWILVLVAWYCCACSMIDFREILSLTALLTRLAIKLSSLIQIIKQYRIISRSAVVPVFTFHTLLYAHSLPFCHAANFYSSYSIKLDLFMDNVLGASVILPQLSQGKDWILGIFFCQSILYWCWTLFLSLWGERILVLPVL